MWVAIITLGCAEEELVSTNEFDTSIEESEQQSSESTLSFESDIIPLFKESSCDNCHGSMMITYGSILTMMAGSFDDVNACILMPWVTPFEPENSYLQHKIDGTFINFSPEYGDTMHLFPGEEDIVRQWILDGALP